jgi:hypothetical protein
MEYGALNRLRLEIEDSANLFGKLAEMMDFNGSEISPAMHKKLKAVSVAILKVESQIISEAR